MFSKVFFPFPEEELNLELNDGENTVMFPSIQVAKNKTRIWKEAWDPHIGANDTGRRHCSSCHSLISPGFLVFNCYCPLAPKANNLPSMPHPQFFPMKGYKCLTVLGPKETSVSAGVQGQSRKLRNKEKPSNQI